MHDEQEEEVKVKVKLGGGGSTDDSSARTFRGDVLGLAERLFSAVARSR